MSERGREGGRVVREDKIKLNRTEGKTRLNFQDCIYIEVGTEVASGVDINIWFVGVRRFDDL